MKEGGRTKVSDDGSLGRDDGEKRLSHDGSICDGRRVVNHGPFHVTNLLRKRGKGATEWSAESSSSNTQMRNELEHLFALRYVPNIYIVTFSICPVAS